MMAPLYTVPENIQKENTVEKKLAHLEKIKRTFFVYRVDAGSCNGCDIEIFAVITPLWDPERLGFKLVASPRHADILVCTGSVTRDMRYPLLRAYEAMPDPKIVAAVGACGCSGGIFHDSYGNWGGIDSHIPVDLYVPGCPPHPATILQGFAIALGLIDQKLKKTVYDNDDGRVPFDGKSILNNILFERDIYMESKSLMGYIHGRVLFKKYCGAMQTVRNAEDVAEVTELIRHLIGQEEDPRYAECLRVLHNNVYMQWLDKMMRMGDDGKNRYLIKGA